MDQLMSNSGLLRAVAERHKKPQERNQLGRYDWLEHALVMFVSEGIASVRITRLADDLGVTRGSFYWHFDNREDLVNALVTFWREKNTTGIIESVRTVASLHQGILNFFETTIDEHRFDPRLDLAIREWSRRSNRIREMLDVEDNLRIDALKHFYKRFDFDNNEALIRARVLYYSQIGFYALEVHEPMEVRLSYTETYYRCFTGKNIPSTEVERFRSHILKTYGEK